MHPHPYQHSMYLVLSLIRYDQDPKSELNPQVFLKYGKEFGMASICSISYVQCPQFTWSRTEHKLSYDPICGLNAWSEGEIPTITVSNLMVHAWTYNHSMVWSGI